MRWGESVQTDRDTDLIIDEVGQFGSPIPLMLEPEVDADGRNPKKIISGKWSPADDADQADDQSISWTDWSLGMTFGRLDRLGRGGYSWGIGIDPRDPRRIMPAGDVQSITMPEGFYHAPIRGMQQYGEHVYMVTGHDDPATQTGASHILRVDNSNSGICYLSGFFNADTAPYFSGRSIVQYRGYLYVGGYNGFMRRKVFDESNPDLGPHDEGVPGDGTGWDSYTFQRIFLAKQTWKVAGIKDYYLIAADTDSSMVFTASSPTIAGNWTSPTGIIQGDTLIPTRLGDQRYKINSVGYSNGRVFWGKTDGVYDVDSTGTAANITPYVEDSYSSTNCSSLYYHDGYIWFYSALGYQRINTSDRVRIDVPEVVQPGYGRPVEGPIYGQITAQTSDAGWIVVGVYNGYDSFILYGKDPAALGLDVPVPIIWHGAFAHFPGKKITAFGKTAISVVAGQTWPQLYIGLWDPIAEEASIARMHRTTNNSPYQMWQQKRTEDEYRFCTNWKIYFTSEDLGLPNTRKALLRGDATTENVTTARKVEIHAAMDSTVYSDKAANGDPFFTLTPPISGTYTLDVSGFGTTTALDYDATAAEITTALTAISGLSASTISANAYGLSTIRITLHELPSTTVVTASGQASMAYHLHGSILSTPRQAFLPPATTPTGFSINVKAEGVGTASEPAILTGLKYRVSLIEDQLEEKEYTVRVGQGVTTRGGVIMTDDPVRLLSRLISYMNRGAIELIDENGRKISAKIRQGIQYTKVEEQGGWYMRVTFRIKIQKQPFYWGDGATWGDIYAFS